MARCQVHPDLRPKLPDPPSDLEEAKSQGVQLHPTCPALEELPSQGVHQPIRYRVEQKPELVGDESMATEAIRLYVQLEVLDPVLALPALGVKLVKLLRFVGPGAHHKAGVGTLLHDFGLVDDPALFLPACGPVETF